MAKTDFDFGRLLASAMAAKAEMIMNETDNTTGVCPKCGGTIRYFLSPGKKHLRGACSTPECDVSLIE